MNQLVGTWQLQSFELQTREGRVAVRPLGEHPVPYIIYI